MPAVVSSVIGATIVNAGLQVGISVGTGIAIANVASYIITGAVLSTAAAALAPRPKSPPLRERTLNISAPAQARRIIYGEVLVGGANTFMESFPTVAGGDGVKDNLAHVLTIAGHECASIGDVYFNDELLTLGTFTSNSGHSLHRITNLTKYGTFTVIEKFLGSDDQTAFDYFVDILPSGNWTTNHRQRGCAYLALKYGWQGPDTFVAGLPTVRAKVKGKKVYDPRDPTQDMDDSSTWKWSNNPPLCIVDFLRGNQERGLGLGYETDEIDWDTVIAAANVSDEQIPLVSGGTQKRYTLNGTIESSEQAKDVLPKMVSSMAGALVYSGGLWRIFAGAPTAVVRAALTDADARARIVVNPRVGRRQLANIMKGTYVEPDRGWQPTDFPPWTSALYKSQDNAEEIARDIQLEFTTDSNTAQRLAKIELERLRQQITVVFPAKLSCLDIRAWDTVSLTIPRYGWSAKKFRVVGWSLTEGYGVDLELREEADEVWDWSLEETTYDPAPDTNLPDPFTVPAPSNVQITNDPILQDDGTTFPRIKISWTAATNGGFIHHHEVQYRKQGATDWEPAPDAPFGTSFVYVQGVHAGQVYEARVRAVNSFGATSEFVSSSGNATGDTTRPGLPTSLSAVGLIKQVEVRWTNPSDTDFNHVRIYRRTDPSTPRFPQDMLTTISGGRGQTRRHVDGDLTPGQTYHYHVQSVDHSGLDSAMAGPVSAVPRKVEQPDVANNAIDTPHLVNNAASNTTGAKGTAGLQVGNNYTTIAAVTVNVSSQGGGVVNVWAFAQIAVAGVQESVSVRLALVRDSTVLFESSQIAIAQDRPLPFPYLQQDTPGAGSHTYLLRVRTTSGVLVASSRSLIVTEHRK